MRNMYNDFVDELANYEFQKLFYGTFGSSKLKFYSDSFQHCLKEVTTTKKPLLFFLHNNEIEESKQYCQLLTDPAIEELICEKFIILGWKLENDEQYCHNLAKKIFIVQNEVLDNLINAKPAIFFIIPNVESVKIHKIIDIDTDSVDRAENHNDLTKLVSAIKDVQEFLSLYEYDSFENMTSAKYHQWIYDELGDRDYDSFESDEHHLLKEKILFAMHGPPKELEGGTIGYDDKQIKESEDLYKKIRTKNNEYSKWNDRIVITFIYNCIEPTADEKEKRRQDVNSKANGNIFSPIPIFVLRKCKRNKNNEEANKTVKYNVSCRIFIDNTGRVYDSWEKYLKNNILPPCKMIYPKDGKYQSKENSSEVQLEEMFSPSCSFTTKLLHTTDIGTGVAGLLSGVVFTASMFTPAVFVAAPVAIAAGGISGTYAAARSTYTLIDRRQHEQCVNIRNTESRAAYLNIAAGTMGVVGAGTTRIVSTLVRNGANIGTGVQYGITAINSANILISGTATINSCSDVIQQYIDDSVVPSALTIAQLGSSLFFFGNSLYHFQTGQTMVQEMQATKLNEISEGLRSNRHRKTFNKMLKETVRIKGEVRGKAEVIASMRNSASRDEVLAVLTRSNRYFNREEIRFSAERGSISLNGVSVDILEYGNMPKTQQSFTLESLPPIPESSSSRYVNNTRSSVQNMRYNERISNLLGIVPFDIGAATRTLTCFTQDIQPKILRICEDFMNQIDVDVIGNLKTLFKEDVRIKIIQYVTDFIRRYVDEIKEIFEKRLLNEEVTTVCQEFGFQNPHVTVYNFIEYIVNQFKNGNMMENLLSEFGKWYISLIYNKELKEERKRKRQETTNERKSCSSCGGYYYEQK